jgi:GxxExxY protein
MLPREKSIPNPEGHSMRDSALPSYENKEGIMSIVDEEDQKTYSIIGAAMEVHRNLGPGFLEAVYQEALCIEFARSSIPFEQEPFIEIKYKSITLHHHYRPDFICYGSIIIELKAQQRLSGTEEAQIINYLKAGKKYLGLLINFGASSLIHRRFILSDRTIDQNSDKI